MNLAANNFSIESRPVVDIRQQQYGDISHISTK